ncbi:hypothetical protein H5410_015629 [Solanum commersonii]|uniref:Uncharacterized protein n=1 Tax=Solanum commersonii TaxID=4109 RepID=A0A9J5ZU14_SOLCO|nr:hypothetical protein H5410_015629 [Solanum commersonii]
MDQQHNIIEVRHTRKYKSYDPFIIPQNVKQTKHVRRIEIDNVLDVAYQNELQLFSNKIMTNVEEEINQNEKNESFDDEECDNENETTEEEE